MSLSSDLISQFAKITNDNSAQKNEDKILYGTIVEYHDSLCVRLDGTNEITPAVTTATVKAGDRVSVELKNHTAIITGNLSDPSLGRMSSDGRFSAIEQSLKEITISVGNIDSQIESRLTVAENQISLAVQNLNNEITSRIGVYDGKIESVVKDQNSFTQFIQDVNRFSFMGNGGKVQISGGDIALSGSIKFTDFVEADQTSLNNAVAAGENASKALKDAASAVSLAETSLDWSSQAWNDASDAIDEAEKATSIAQSIADGDYIGGTFIDKNHIMSPIIEGNNIRVYGTFQTRGKIEDEDGEDVWTTTGYMGAAKGLDANGDDTYGVALSYKWDRNTAAISDNYIIVTNAGVRMQAGSHKLVVTKNGAFYDDEEIATK